MEMIFPAKRTCERDHSNKETRRDGVVIKVFDERYREEDSRGSK